MKYTILFLIAFSMNLKSFSIEPKFDVKVKNCTDTINPNGEIFISIEKSDKKKIYGLFTKGYKVIKSDTLTNNQYIFKNLKKGYYRAAVLYPELKDTVVYFKNNPIILK